MASDIWLRTILIVRKETRCRHIGYSFRLTARVLLYAPSHRQDNTYHGLCYTSRGALAGTRNSSMGPPHEGSIRRLIAPWANALPLSYVWGARGAVALCWTFHIYLPSTYNGCCQVGKCVDCLTTVDRTSSVCSPDGKCTTWQTVIHHPSLTVCTVYAIFSVSSSGHSCWHYVILLLKQLCKYYVRDRFFFLLSQINAKKTNNVLYYLMRWHIPELESSDNQYMRFTVK